MDSQQASRGCNMALFVLVIAVLLIILNGYFRVADVRSGARIFQISCDVLLPMSALFVATTDWTKPFKSLRLLAFLAVAVGLAFAALYYLGNYFHTAHHH